MQVNAKLEEKDKALQNVSLDLLLFTLLLIYTKLANTLIVLKLEWFLEISNIE